MNRQQRRARVKLNRAEWCLRIQALGKSLPQEKLSDVGMAQLLTEIIVDEQLNISDTSLATLASLACACMDRAIQALPPATHVDQDGHPVYSAEQIAAFTGQAAAQVEQGLGEFAKEAGETFATGADVQPLH